MPKFFIDHPVFAWVVAILISLGGVISILNLGVESYPSVAPPQVTVSATYPGASAATAEKSVTQVIEQQLTGIDNLVYFSSSSSSTGRVSITLTFDSGTDPDIAQVQVQNKVALATPRLPSEVTKQGVVVAKANAGFLMAIGVRSDDGSVDRDALNDIVGSRVLDQISRVPGVGSTQQFGSEYAMRIWLNPEKLQGYHLSATDVYNAIGTQNLQFAAGSVGGDPAPNGQAFTATVAAEGRYSSPEEFENTILRANADGSVVRLKDVASVAFGASNYGFDTRYNGKPVAAFAVQLLPGANALDVSKAVRAKMDDLAPSFPPGVSWFTPFDSTTFVNISIKEVVNTLVEAVVLVFLVMLIFLQNFRATIIPTLVIPVALLGTFMGMLAIGFTINQLTLFAMVLAIGIVVDDAIVVIENVERIMSEDKLDPKPATQKAMGQITGAVVAITVVLAAVFIPSAMQPGASGEIYKQFALTIAMSMGFSALLALSFTPALCAAFLKPTHNDRPNWIYRTFNTYYGKLEKSYVGSVGSVIRHSPRWLMVFALLLVLCGFLFTRLPGSFLPEEDQGYALAIVQLPPGATKTRTSVVFDQLLGMMKDDPSFEGMMQVTGFSFVGSGENVGMAFIRLKDWDARKETAPEFIQKMNGKAFVGIKDAQVFFVNLPTVQGLGQFGGFDMWLQDRAGAGQDALMEARNTLIGAASADKSLVGVRPNTLENAPQLQLKVDRVQAQAMGVSVNDVYTAIQMMLAPVYVNDFFYGGRIKRVNMQADAAYRTGPESLRSYYVPSALSKDADGQRSMIPLSTVVKSEWIYAPPALSRYNGYSAVNIVGSPAPGGSSGQAMATMENLVRNDLPNGFGYDWSGMSYQEILAGNAAALLMVLSVVVVFLCLAALYESWSIPVSVLLVVPVGILGAVVFSLLRGLPNDLYFKIGMVTVIGLAAKNAILIVEFAVEQRAAGKTLREAAIEAAHLRFRPILMTSFAFILGVLPMAISTGAGANARHSLGTGVIGGMLFATVIGVLLIPLFFVTVRRVLGDKLDEPSRQFIEQHKVRTVQQDR
ncbi:MAG: multidrug efflux RND transporter permease [Lysobacteraceae bacterium SCN 69-123]|jgi:multidrug efflux pump|uniref:multidrug efflux RND transporter permease subunit n=1 Tax=Stenotrophomonas acidaminiphila TaxID=128780 RepID=UPI00086839DB|nr:multidrug efflux RND transporter permease subunit [Stenotrophomonas acidaminiphila]MBN8803002.1 multidrug efflux RND transporter permease subunit [Stenotrophomonas acidaminiphila]MDF9443493.1 multidrug efflux RND transporter permease subunit [Stenotrophomonas acidaminiphila]ODU46067.1 MAG: multidrug efflux RND transporter permease [Xanthomonadaceae bacterium SCN 69-123]OJY73775.1 MAG: multidrug efflux RND transporter permease [Stenotrophomonas sp. 69-14]